MTKSSSILLQQIDERRIAVGAALDPDRRPELGQYFTPSAIAERMAELFRVETPDIHILDAGAGVGSLSAALIVRICESRSEIRVINLTAFEIDPALISALELTLSDCQAHCRARQIELKWKVRCEDFLNAAVLTLQGDAWSDSIATPSIAILNPPYKKLSASSPIRKSLQTIGVETTNLYSAFLGVAIQLLARNGELVAITPRSFCNGPYFRTFRRQMLSSTALRAVHVFERRDVAFGEDEVLQENVIFHVVKGAAPDSVRVSQSSGADWDSAIVRDVPYPQVVHPSDPDAFIHIAPTDDSSSVVTKLHRDHVQLSRLNLSVSTGRVVDFRIRSLLQAQSTVDSIPLIYPQHLHEGEILWPKPEGRKPNALILNSESAPLVVPVGTYVLVKRFSAKEERRRVVAAVCLGEKFAEAHGLAFENHLNYFHLQGAGLETDLAYGLAHYLNSTLVDCYFRQFSGHTQVNATDLKRLPYPSKDRLKHLGALAGAYPITQIELDEIVETSLFSTDLAAAR